MAQLDQNLCKQEKQKRKRTEMREKDKKEGKRVSSNQTHLSTITKICSHKYPSATLLQGQAKKNLRLHLRYCQSKKAIFYNLFIIARLIWAFGALGLGQSFTEKTGKQKPSLSLSLSLPLLFPFIISLPISFSLLLSLNIFSLLKGFFLTVKKMKKMKGVVAADSSTVAALNAQARLKHQSLSQDYQELLKDTDARKNRLHRVNQKKLTLSAEVGFLRRRRKFLLKNQSRNPLLKQDFVAPKILQPEPQPQHKNIVRRGIRDYNTNEGFELNQMERNDNVKEVALHCPPNQTENQNQRERIHNGKETALRYPIPATQRIYNGNEVGLPHPALNNLNRRERIHNLAKAALRNPLPGFNVHQKERVCDAALAPIPVPGPALFFIKNQKGPVQSGKDDAPRSFVRAFDLNQISVYN